MTTRNYILSGYGVASRLNGGIYESSIKRPLGFILALLAIILLSPFLLALAVIVRCNLGSPVIFRQERVGKDGKSFVLYKFRSMTEERGADGELLADELRLTKFGRLLRSTSLDELPELINILRGDMSFVGPRPLLAEYMPLYSANQRRRHEVRPGLTGLAQVKGRNKLKWEERFELDTQYVAKISFCYDFKLIIMTIPEVLKRSGISCDTSATMELFRGDVDISTELYADF